MTQSNKVNHETLGLTIGWSLLAVSTFVVVAFPNFIEATMRGKFQPSLITEEVNTHIATLQELLGKQPPAKTVKQFSVNRLFGEVGKLGPGAIAIGNAEGTLKANGRPTWAYYGHIDPANWVTNKGFASWQATRVKTAKEADQKAIHRIRTQCIPYTTKSFRNEALTLTPRLLVESCDIWIQAPRAAVDFAANYKQCQEDGKFGETALLCARVNNYINPATGKFEVASIFRKPGALVNDQKRRMTAIARTLQRFKISTTI